MQGDTDSLEPHAALASQPREVNQTTFIETDETHVAHGPPPLDLLPRDVLTQERLTEPHDVLILGELNVDRDRAFVGGDRSRQVATEEVEGAPPYQRVEQAADGKKSEARHPPAPANRPRVRAPNPKTPNPIHRKFQSTSGRDPHLAPGAGAR